ncbi:MAG TPA: T9SS type A sorting domain-containing protein, partial [Bacteroidia bacterium]|nr:T9SS type A sorting domain-containing protein [Bacteroidia bacterium]
TTIAGRGVEGTAYNSDGGPADSAYFWSANGIVVDDSGNVYISDNGNNVIRKVNPAGIITTIVGQGTSGLLGDGGPSDSAAVWNPAGLALDAAENLYIADSKDNIIRKITKSTGIITTIAGNDTAGYAGNGGPATSAELNYPNGVAVDDSGNVYIADTYNNVIRKVNTAGIISNFAGDTAMGYNGDGILATSAKLNYPWNISLDACNNLYIADGNNNRIRKVSSGHCSLQCKAGFDLSGCLSICIDTPSFSSASINAGIFNNRCVPVKGTMKLVIDTAIHITSTIADSVAKIHGDTLIWNFDSLSTTGKSHYVSLSGTVSSIPLGDSVFVTMLITPLAGDSVPSNNSITHWVKAFPFNCIGLPFDPNEKSVSPQGNISASQKLTYSIQFQNTGTALARNVVVIDTLSPKLDPTTLSILSSSYNMTTLVISGHIVKFIFNNIDLPDTATSRTSSIGTLSYSIMPMNTDVAGDKIMNTAGIYFDSNPVVKTNTTLNTINGLITSVQNFEPVLHMACFPNPFTTTTSVVFNIAGKHYLELDDVTGRKIETIECMGRQYELQRNNLVSGIYFIKAYDEGHTYISTSKIVVQ